MSERNENHPINEAVEDQPSMSERRPRRRIRFGLLELLLLTAVIAAWLPVVVARRQIPGLEVQIQTMRMASTDLIVMDEQQLTARTLPSIWHNISGWKYSAPQGADLELRLATEGINSIAYPANYQAASLPEGEHSIHLKVTSDAEGCHTEVYVDKERVLQQHHGRGWLSSFGSSSSGDVAPQSTEYPADQPLRLHVQRYAVDHPLQEYQSVEIPDEYDNKGNYLWISPRSIVPQAPSDFFTPRPHYAHDAIGHRQGIKVCRSSQMGMVGLIGIQPSLSATLGDQRFWASYPYGLSVRPVLDGESEPESPETQSNPESPEILGLPLSFRDTIDAPARYDRAAVNVPVTSKAISADGKHMRVFAHFPPFASGAKPIVEILFDAEHPNRVGFLPHAAPDSAPMNACQFVTQFDARFLWREIETLPESEFDSVSAPANPLPVPLAQLYPEIDFENLVQASDSAAATLPWNSIPLARLPQINASDTGTGMYRMSLLTDVADTSKLTFPLGLETKWQYTGVANRQVWWLPADSANASEPGITVDVRASTVFPTTTLPLPGGPAIGNVRITVPMPATQPVWLEIVAEPATEN